MLSARTSQALFASIFGTGIAADLLSKHVVFRHLLAEGDTRTVWSPFFSLKRQQNEGGVWGLLSGTDGSNSIFLVLSLAAIAAILVYLVAAVLRGHRLPLSLAAILAGAFGNLWDRVFFHSVRDFISVKIGTFYWPTFNVADSLICVGCAVMALGLLRAPEPESALPPAAAGEAPAVPPAAPGPAPERVPPPPQAAP